MERLESEAEQRSFVPDSFMRSALKSVTQMQAVKKAVADGGTAARGGARKPASAKESGERDRRPASRSDKKGNPDSGASTSQKKGGSGSK